MEKNVILDKSLWVGYLAAHINQIKMFFIEHSPSFKRDSMESSCLSLGTIFVILLGVSVLSKNHFIWANNT